MASSLSRQTTTIKIIRIQSHIKQKKIPPKLWKRIERQKKFCDKTFNYTTTLTDWKSKIKPKQNLIDDQYEIDEKSVNDASTIHALVVGSENYNQQYPQLAYQNLTNIFGTIHRRMQRKQWDIPQSIKTELGVNIFTPISFNNQLKNNKTKQSKKRILPFILKQIEAPQSVLNLKDGSEKKNMPYFINNDGNIQVLLYRDIKCNLKSRNRIQKVINCFDPDSIIMQCNAHNFRQFHKKRSYFMNNIMNFMFGSVTPSSVMDSLVSISNKGNKNVIAANLCEAYHELLYNYAFLCDLFSLSAIEISPVLENKILPKKIKTISTKLLKANSKLTSEMRYVIQPYFFPHLHLFGQTMNAYLIHCLYGCVNELNSKRILIIVNDDNVYDLITKLESNPESGYYFKYSYNSLFKQVNDEFVTMPTVLPQTYLQNSSVKLKEFEWKRLHSMFGMKFVEFLENEMAIKQALVVK